MSRVIAMYAKEMNRMRILYGLMLSLILGVRKWGYIAVFQAIKTDLFLLFHDESV